MKNIKSLMIACLAIGAGAMTSCTDKMDNWGTDASHSRLFSVTSLSVTPEATTATVEYKGGSGATAYQIQVSTEKLNDDIEPYAEGTITIESTSMTTAVVTGLFSETNYYLRIRAIGEGKNPSLWAYYINSTDHEYFTTKGEQIMNAVLDEAAGLIDRLESVKRQKTTTVQS